MVMSEVPIILIAKLFLFFVAKVTRREQYVICGVTIQKKCHFPVFFSRNTSIQIYTVSAMSFQKFLQVGYILFLDRHLTYQLRWHDVLFKMAGQIYERVFSYLFCFLNWVWVFCLFKFIDCLHSKKWISRGISKGWWSSKMQQNCFVFLKKKKKKKNQRKEKKK
eukprot:TRINITY_DN61069_c0_g1_i1.p5 TRINITY_DN61069_c0_g1~~TRINITY_DN61069_c0_g1_i1.p5  ORF type:complete len:164 (-),score=7.72 TRINITY_DN61069_c0_g1_i1:32-523(-)